MDNEGISIAQVEREIYRSRTLQTYISRGDKTPSWDGEIFVYKDDSRDKANIIGKVPVQVKGRTVKHFSKRYRTFPVKVSDLNNYKISDGILFFLVEIISPINAKIFYASLLPIDLHNILKDKSHQDSVNLTFTEYDYEYDGEVFLEYLCLNFIINQKNQKLPASLIGIGPKDLKFEKYTGKIIAKNEHGFRKFIKQEGIYIYGQATLNGETIDVPVDKITLSKIKEKRIANVYVNQKHYFDSYYINFNDDGITLYFDSSIKVTITKKSKINVYFKHIGNVIQRIESLMFILDLIKSQHISLAGKEIQFDKLESIAEVSEEIEEQLRLYQSVKDLLDYLGLTTKLSLDTLTDNDLNQLEYLHQILIVKNYDTMDKLENPFTIFYIGNCNIVIVQIKNGVHCHAFDLFDTDAIKKLSFVYKSEQSDHPDTAHSIYLGFANNAVDLFKISNLNLSVVEKSIMSFDTDNEQASISINNLLLGAIKCYDENGDAELLDFSLRMYEHLEENYIDEETTFLNKMQILKRMRELTKEEKSEIILRKNKAKNTSFLCGYLLLIDNWSEFEYHFETLPIQEQEMFRSYPIYNLKNISRPPIQSRK